jgi:hypothetical protein
VLSIPELINAEELKRITLHAFAFKTVGWIGRFLAKRGKAPLSMGWFSANATAITASITS